MQPTYTEIAGQRYYAKQDFADFAVGDRVECTEQLSAFFGLHGTIDAAGPGKWMLNVRYDDGHVSRVDCTRCKNKRVWLRKLN